MRTHWEYAPIAIASACHDGFRRWWHPGKNRRTIAQKHKDLFNDGKSGRHLLQ
jgi:hypothetical protein